MSVLMVDVGGSNVKMMAAHDGEMRKIPSGPTLSGEEMIRGVLEATKDWEYEKVSVGFPSLIREGRPIREPLNLGGGWLDIDYNTAFGRPVRFINDAAMQALGNYDKGRLLFLGLGTSIGTSVIVDDNLIPIEIGMIKLTRKARFMDRLSKVALKEGGKTKWLVAVHEAVKMMQDVFHPDETVLGGGNSKLIDPLPENCRRVNNRSAYVGARRLWENSDLYASACATSWRIHRNEAHS